MSDTKLSSEMIAEAARLSGDAVRKMKAAIPELPYGMDNTIDDLIEKMRDKSNDNPEAAGIALPIYRQLMRLGALVAIDAITNQGGSL